MKNIVVAVLFLLIASVVNAGPACCAVGKDAKKSPDNVESSPQGCSIDDLKGYIRAGINLSTDDLQHLIKSDAKIVLIDARTPEWDDGKRIASAKNLTPESSDEDIESALGAKDSYVVTYCGSVQCPLSHKMADRLKGLGYANTLVYPDGIAGWTKAGNAVN